MTKRGGVALRVSGARRAISRLAIAAGAGGLTGLAAPARWGFGIRSVIGWNVASAMFAAMSWLVIARYDATRTRARAAADDPGRTLVWILVAGASTFSLFAAVVLMRAARHAASELRDIEVVLCVSAVALAWLLTHTSYALRYAHLYYRDDHEGVGGLEFPGGNTTPCYFDFAYLALTVGMCFQVSDVTVSSPQIRRALLSHALLSFIYNTVVMAVALNLVLGIFA